MTSGAGADSANACAIRSGGTCAADDSGSEAGKEAGPLISRSMECLTKNARV